MSPESERQFFTQREKSPEESQVFSEVSPEKKEEAIQCAVEIRRIREKKIPTEEDLARVEELNRRIKRIYSSETQFESEKAKERLEILKKTPLWDEKRKQWNRYMDENQELGSSYRYSYDQLLGVLVEAVTGNSEEAKERLKALKETPLWDEEKKQWNWFMDENQGLGNSDRHSYDQLLGALVEAITGNSKEAKERLKALKETPLWDEERKQWNLGMDKNQGFKNSDRSSHDQLLGVLVEAVTGNSKEAKERLKALKETPLWDEKRKQWNRYMDENQGFKDSDRSSHDQLLGVLVEAVTGNSKEAKERLKALKKTPLWDEKRKQWNGSMDENQELQNSDRSSHDQLLGVLAEAFYEKEEEFVEWLMKEK